MEEGEYGDKEDNDGDTERSMNKRKMDSFILRMEKEDEYNNSVMCYDSVCFILYLWDPLMH